MLATPPAIATSDPPRRVKPWLVFKPSAMTTSKTLARTSTSQAVTSNALPARLDRLDVPGDPVVAGAPVGHARADREGRVAGGDRVEGILGVGLPVQLAQLLGQGLEVGDLPEALELTVDLRQVPVALDQPAGPLADPGDREVLHDPRPRERHVDVEVGRVRRLEILGIPGVAGAESAELDRGQLGLEAGGGEVTLDQLHDLGCLRAVGQRRRPELHGLAVVTDLLEDPARLG